MSGSQFSGSDSQFDGMTLSAFILSNQFDRVSFEDVSDTFDGSVAVSVSRGDAHARAVVVNEILVIPVTVLHLHKSLVDALADMEGIA